MNTSVDRTTEVVYQRADGVLSRAAGDELLLLTIGATSMLRLDAVSRALWESIGETKSRGQIALHLAARFGAPIESVVADIGDALEQLVTSGALIRSDRTR